MPVQLFTTASLESTQETKISTASLVTAADEGEDTPVDDEETTEVDAAEELPEDMDPEDPASRLEHSVEDDSEHIFNILDSYFKLMPAPSSKNLSSLADAFELEGQDREDFLLLCIDMISGSDDEPDLDADDELSLDEDDTESSEEASTEDDAEAEDAPAEDEEEPAEQDRAMAALLNETRAMTRTNADSLTDVLNNDGAAVNQQPNADDVAIQNDGDMAFETVRPATEPPVGTNDGEPDAEIPSV